MTDGAAIAAGLLLLTGNHLSALYLQSPLLPVVLIGCIAIVVGAGGLCRRRLLPQKERHRASFKSLSSLVSFFDAGLNVLLVAAGLALGTWLWSAWYR